MFKNFKSQFTRATSFPFKMTMLTLLWVSITVILTVSLLNYANQPGNPGQPPDQWPVGINLNHDSIMPTLLLFIHPHCPCTRASVGELAKIMSRCRGKVAAYAIIVKPNNVKTDWENGYLNDFVKEIPELKVIVDDSAKLATSFLSKTSGMAILYDNSGSLLFYGGITASRGHEGDNYGESAIIEFVSGHKPEHVTTPVFGCALLDSVCTMEEIN